MQTQVEVRYFLMRFFPLRDKTPRTAPVRDRLLNLFKSLWLQLKLFFRRLGQVNVWLRMKKNKNQQSETSNGQPSFMRMTNKLKNVF